MSNKIQNLILFSVILFNLILFGHSFEGIVKFEPSLTLVDNEDEMISLNCSISSNSLTFDYKVYSFIIKQQDSGSDLLFVPDYSNSSYSYKQFNYSYKEWKSKLNIGDGSFKVECYVWDQSSYSEPYSVQIMFRKGYNESCSESSPCSSSSNLVCSNETERCECRSEYIGIAANSSGHYNCCPKVGYNESCVDDRQCRAVDPNTDCGIFDGIRKRCQCSEYYAFDGTKCYSDSHWLCFQWTLHPIDAIIILMALFVGLSLLLIVILISLHLRAKKRRALIDSKTFRYPSSLTPKVIVSKYFHKSDDQKYLKSYDYVNTI